MTQSTRTALPSHIEPGDAELIHAVRGGDLDAYGVLFERHVEAARRLARQLVSSGEVDDLVSETFAKVLAMLQKGGGPDLAFRAYLLTSMRRVHVDRIRAGARLHSTDDLTPYDPGIPFEDTAVAGFESAAAAKAFASLPERWQQVLWHTEVEGQRPAEIAPLLGMSANSVSALAYRAREGLREAFVTMHAQDAADEACAVTRANLGPYIRGGISRRDAAKVESHLKECRPCTAIYLELVEVNSDLGAVIAPLVLGSAGAGYAAASHAAGLAGAKAALVLLVDRGKDWAASNPVLTAGAGIAAAAVVGGGVIVGVTYAHHHPPPAAAGASAPLVGSSRSEAPSPSHGSAGGVRTPSAGHAHGTRTRHAAAGPARALATRPSLPAQASSGPTSVLPLPQVLPAPAVPAAPQGAPHPSVPAAPSVPPAPSAPPAPSVPPSPPAPSPSPPPSPPVDTGPVIRTPLPPMTVEAATPLTIDLTRGAISPVGYALHVASAAAGHGTVRIDGRTATYTPRTGWRGADVLTYVLGDGHGGTVAGSVGITTLDAPPVAVDDTFRAHRWHPAYRPVRLDPLGNDSDPNGDRLTIVDVAPASAGGTVLIVDAGRSLTYEPRRGFVGAETFAYTISDGHGRTATATVTVLVGHRPHPLHPPPPPRGVTS